MKIKMKMKVKMRMKVKINNTMKNWYIEYYEDNKEASLT